MNRMIRDIATHNVHPENRAIFSISNTALNNATKYAIAKKQPASGFTAKFGSDRWSNTAKHIAKQIHDFEIHSFDDETLEPLSLPERAGLHPTRMEWKTAGQWRKPVHKQPRPHTVLVPSEMWHSD